MPCFVAVNEFLFYMSPYVLDCFHFYIYVAGRVRQVGVYCISAVYDARRRGPHLYVTITRGELFNNKSLNPLDT